MFRSAKKHLSTVLCPKFRTKRSCSIPFCLFSHEIPSNSLSTHSNSLKRPLSSTAVPGGMDLRSHEKKARKVISDETLQNDNPGLPNEQPLKDSLQSTVENSSSYRKTTPENGTIRSFNIKPIQSRSFEVKDRPLLPSSSSFSSRTSSVSSLPALSSPNSAVGLNLKKDCILSPKPVMPFAPATNQQRLIYLKAISKNFQENNHRFPNFMAVTEEHKIAQRTSKITYANEIRHLVARIKRNDDLNVKIKIKPVEVPKISSEEVNRRLSKLIINSEVLVKHSYAVRATIASLDSSFKDSELKSDSNLRPDNLVNCDRCDVLFNVLSKDSRIGNCVHHPGKKRRANAGSTTSVDRDLFYTCCSEPVGNSSGCKTNNFHVFKHKTLAGLAGAIPYRETTSKVTPNTRYAVGIDCEMAYTTLGMELIRVTVVDWDTGKAILDRLVMPKGELLDLNSTWSGVHSLEEGLTSDDGQTHPTLAFEQALDMVFGFVNKNTIIVGHGLENDLNALRLIHEKVVDTAIHYPKFNSYRKRSLKDLAAMYLKREIQHGEHDSSEDAIAAIDIVKVNIGCVL